MTVRIDERIATLEEKLSELKVRQQRIEARKLALAARYDRKAETRKKILLGGVILEPIGFLVSNPLLTLSSSIVAQQSPVHLGLWASWAALRRPHVHSARSAAIGTL